MIHALRYTEELEKVGFTTEQAKKSVQVWMELMDQNFATKADFKEHYFMTKTDMIELSNMLKDENTILRKEINSWTITFLNRFDEIDKRFTEIDKRFTEIDKRFTEIDKRFAQVDKHFTEIDKRFTDIDHKFDKLESRLTIKLGIMMAASIGIVSTIINFSK